MQRVKVRTFSGVVCEQEVYLVSDRAAREGRLEIGRERFRDEAERVADTRTERAWNNAEYPIERICSVCGLRRNIETQVAWNFCPNCGAKMKGGE